MEKRNSYKIICFFVMLIAALYLVQSSFCYARETDSEVRVGLTSSYTGVDEICIYNRRVKLGYYKNGCFSPELKLSSDNSCISFKPENETYYVSEDTYKSYSEAASASENLKKTCGYPSEIGLYGSRCWKLYISLSEYKKEASIFEDGPDVLKLNAKNFKKIRYSDYLIRVTNGSKIFFIDGSNSKSYPQIEAASEDTAGIYSLSLGKRNYRGRIEIGRYKNKNGVCAVNFLGLEEYLYGVITCEMSASYDAEALKAQAVCARSYALCKSSSDYSISEPYELTDTAATQVYGGLNYETNASRNAVLETKGEVLTKNGDVISAFYYSTSGGHTEYGSTVWGVKSSLYQGVEDEFELDPEKKPWIITYTRAELVYMLSNKGHIDNSVNDIRVSSLTESGRALSVKLYNAAEGNLKSSAKEVSGTDFASAISLPSTKFRILRNGDTPWNVTVKSSDAASSLDIRNANIISAGGKITKVSDSGLSQIIVKSFDNLYNIPLQVPSAGSFSFAGMGHGHGVGLSQSGANGLAKQGFDYKSILNYYFKGISITKIKKDS